MEKITMETSLDDVLKEDIMPEIYFEDKAVKVYGKLAGLTNLGKTYFTNWGEISKA